MDQKVANAPTTEGLNGLVTESIAATIPNVMMQGSTVPKEPIDETMANNQEEKDVEDAGKKGGAKKDATLQLERRKEVDPAAQSVSLLKLFQFADRLDQLLIVLGTIGAICNGISQPLMTLLFGALINAFGKNAQTKGDVIREVSEVALKYVYLGIASSVAAYFQVACWMVAGERQSARIRSQYLRAILRQDITFFDTDTSTGEVIARMSGDAVLIQEALGEKTGKSIQLASTFIGGYAVAFSRNWKLTLVAMSVMPILIGSGSTMAIFLSKLTNKGQAAYAGAGNIVEQVVGSIRTVAAYTGEKKAVEDYDKNLKGAESAGIWQGLILGAGFGVVMGTIFVTYSLSLWYGAKLVLSGSLNGGEVINVIFAVLMGAMAMGQASPCISTLANGRAAAWKIFEVIKRSPPIDVYDESGVVPEKVNGDLELRNVDFRYPTRTEAAIFKNFSLLIPAGKTVALVGESGSGKSTVVSLIERFYDPEGGQVLLDGVDIKSIQLKWLRQQIGLVSQEPILFSASIRENIAYGKDDATTEEIETAAYLANATKFITRIPQGFDTLVGERGIQLSGGQKQRVAIARAILKNPRILLLDEATSALDAQSERVVQDALDRVMTNRTTVVIAHRLTTIRNADTIAVVDHGVIVETGTHDELISKPDGAYTQLIRLQEVYMKHEAETTPVKTKDDPDQIASLDEINDGIESARPSSVRKSVSDFMSALGGLTMGLTHSGSRRVSHDGTISHRPSAVSNADGIAFRNSYKSFGDAETVMKEVGDLKKKKPPSMTESSIFRLAKLNRPEASMFGLGLAAACCAGLVFPIFGLLLSSVIASFYVPRDKIQHEVDFWALMFLVLATVVAVATPTKTFAFSYIGQKLIRRVRRLTFEKVVQMEVGWFDEEEHTSGAIGSRLSVDAAAVKNVVGDTLSLSFQNAATIIAAIAIAFSANWQLACLVLGVVPLLVIQGYTNIQWMKGFSANAKEKYEDAGRVANDAVGSIRTVASFVAEDRICSLYDEKCTEPVRTGIKQGLVAGMALAISNFILFSTFAVCFYVGGRLVNSGTTTFKNVFRVFFAISMSSNGVTMTTSMAPDFAKVKLSVNSIFALLDRKSKIDPSDSSGKTLAVVKGDIEFSHVSFFYETRPELEVFHDLSFKVKTGQTLALVGESGSGKSTVIALMERFYNPQSGTILLDGVDISTLNLKWLRQQMGLVSQEPVLFDENVDWNIVYGQESTVTEAEIQRAAEAANCHKFISALPQGYKTRVGDRGTQLSGGQKQRVAIARAICKDPKILLLDEATSALDAESEHVVQEALDRIMVNRTTVVVAHRLTTVRNADIIAVVKNGGIVEQGRHEELIAKNGAYAALVQLHTHK